jgi:hypothetical protein
LASESVVEGQRYDLHWFTTSIGSVREAVIVRPSVIMAAASWVLTTITKSS